MSTKGQIVLPQPIRKKVHASPGDAFEFMEGDEPNVIIMRKIASRPNRGLIDALLACPHSFEVPRGRRDYPKRPKL